jgi:hypothetical protein
MDHLYRVYFSTGEIPGEDVPVISNEVTCVIARTQDMAREQVLRELQEEFRYPVIRDVVLVL